MTDLVTTRDRAGALRAAQVYAYRVRDDLAMEPDREVVELAEEIRNRAIESD